jgi:hypothetical protein
LGGKKGGLKKMTQNILKLYPKMLLDINVKLLLVFSILVMILFSGCTGKSDIVGKWSVHSLQEGDVTIQFSSDGKVVADSKEYSYTGTYRFPDDKHLIIEYDGKSPLYLEVVSLSGNTMDLKDSGGYLWTYKRI